MPFEQVLITADESLIENLADAALPYETVVGDQLRIRITRAGVDCEDGLALVRLDGRLSLADRPEDDAFADATVYGTLSDFRLSPEEGVLRGRVEVIAFETQRVRLLGDDRASVRGLIRDLARLRLEAFEKLDYSLGIPVRLAHELVLPHIGPEGGVDIREARLPLDVAVTDVNAFDGRLWISVRLFGGGR